MKKIPVFGTTISGYNLDNQIIMEAAYKQLQNIFHFAFFFKLPYMEIQKHTLDYIKISNFIFLAEKLINK